MRKHFVGGFTAASLALGLAGTASAGPLYDTTVSTCTTDNCSSVSVGGSMLAWNAKSAYPWVGQIFALGAECLRLDVTNEGQDLEIVAISPNGDVFRNDDRISGFDRRPLVEIQTVTRGWYTVQVSTVNGDPVDADFWLAFGRYNSANPNCANPTAARAAALAATAAKGGGTIGPSALGGPASSR
jgi:hypothetical protein